MTRLSLRGTWDGAPAPAHVGGTAALELRDGLLRFTWDVGLPGPPRVPATPPAFLDGLWEHDVVELFVTASPPDDPSPEYVEIEVGPAGHWLALSFRGVRRGEAELRSPAPSITTRVDEHGRWVGSFEAPARFPGGASLRGLAALCTTLADGSRLYLCSQPLPGERADFHQPRAWSRITAGREGGSR